MKKTDKMTVNQYVQWKMVGITDSQIMGILGYKNVGYSRPIQQWKKANKIPMGIGKVPHLKLDIEEVRCLINKHSYNKVAEYYNIDKKTFYYWILKTRKEGIWI